MATQNSKQNMPLKSFTRNLRRGLGSAIIELKNSPEREMYRDAVMKSSIKDIAYDTQVEGTKGYYLYTAIKTFDNHDEFLNHIAEKFSKRLYWRLSEQLYDMLCCFSNDGYQAASEAFENKYNELIHRLPAARGYGNSCCEREQLEKLMIRKMDSGFELFKQCVNDMGEMIIKHGNDDCLWYDWFLTNAEERFGKDIYVYIEGEENENIAAFNRAHKKSKPDESDRLNFKIVTVNDFIQSYRFEQSNSEEENVTTIEQLIDYAKELSSKADNTPFRIRPLSRKFAKHAKQEELKSLAHLAIDESSDFIKIALFHVFKFADFPLDIGLLLPYMTSENEDLLEIVVEVLSRIKDKRIHSFAIRLFNDKQVENAIALLKTNFEIEDEALIRKHVMRSSRVTHSIIMSITDIYRNYKSSTCGDILLHLYKNAECSHCRCNIVEIMINNEVIPKNVLKECLYDSYEETRELARKALINENGNAH